MNEWMIYLAFARRRWVGAEANCISSSEHRHQVPASSSIAFVPSNFLRCLKQRRTMVKFWSLDWIGPSASSSNRASNLDARCDFVPVTQRIRRALFIICNLYEICLIFFCLLLLLLLLEWHWWISETIGPHPSESKGKGFDLSDSPWSFHNVLMYERLVMAFAPSNRLISAFSEF